jgi:hypothetical protein
MSRCRRNTKERDAPETVKEQKILADYSFEVLGSLKSALWN